MAIYATTAIEMLTQLIMSYPGLLGVLTTLIIWLLVALNAIVRRVTAFLAADIYPPLHSQTLSLQHINHLSHPILTESLPK